MNKRLMLQVADAIEHDPQSYNQGYWGVQTGCGMTMCLGGHAVTLEGYTLIFDQGDTAWECEKDGIIYDLEEKANEVLGLTETRHGLFHAAWMTAYSAEDVAVEVRRIAIGDRELPNDPFFE